LLFFIAAATQFLYLTLVFGRVAFVYKFIDKGEDEKKPEGVSVIIAARNEREHLEKLIPELFRQDYPVFEVVVVNDRSTDDTEDLLRELSAHFPLLRPVNIRYTPDHVTAKKYALTLGIKVSKYDIVLLTDADCKPVSTKWVRLMSAPVRNANKIFALGHGSYLNQPGILNKMIQFETMLTALYCFSFGLWQAPFMGIGRNLCYRKDFFMEQKAFKNLWHIEGGDDDLFVNRHANKKNTAVVIHPESITVSIPKTSFKDYLIQKNRHFHAGKYYKPKDKLKLGIYSFSHLVFWGTALIILVNGRSWEPITLVIGLILSRAFLQYAVMKGARKKLEGAGKVLWTMFFDLMYMIYFWIVGTKGYLSKTVRWK
jgi:glycosyltransferase involved in cell wall biosynthesis